MPHLRRRYLQELLKKDLSWSPIVAVLGMRQIGKTTLIKQITSHYLTLDDDTILSKFLIGEWGTLEGCSQVCAIDECQKAPKIFDRVKYIVDQKKKPGQFILTGSVRFLSKRQIKESLTGRTSILELLPLTLAELHQEKQSHTIKMILSQEPENIIETLKRRHKFSFTHLSQYSNTGGMPGICFKREERLRKELWSLHLETLLSRDINLLYETNIEYIKLRQLLQQLARNQGSPANYSELARIVGLSSPTVKKIISAMEGLFLIRSHGDTFYLEDQGLALFLAGEHEENFSKQTLQSLVYCNLLAELKYQYRGLFEFTNYRSRGGADIPFLIRIHNSTPIAITVDATEYASNKSMKSISWYQRKFSKTKGVILHVGREGYITHGGQIAIPVNWIF